MVVRASSEQERNDSLKEEQKRIALIERALSIYTPSGSEQKLAELIFYELESINLNPEFDRVGNVLCSCGEDSSRSILLCGHMDTVPGILPVRREGDIIYGRGACDAKGSLLSLLFAFENLARDPSLKGKVTFAAVVDEENRSLGLKHIIENNIRADFAIFGEPCGLSKVTIGYRGHMPTTIRVRTHEAHGSAPWLAQNSAELAFSLYDRIKGLWPSANNSSTHEISVKNVSVALTEIHGGTVHNVTPLETSITLDIRIPNRITIHEARQSLEVFLEEVRKENPDATFVAEYDEPTEPYRSRLDSELVRSISRAMLKSHGPIRPMFVEKSGTGDMNKYARAFGVDAVTYGPGDTKLSHTPEEAVNISEVFACADIIVRAVLELFQMGNRER
jgi:[amino group carrier protein]-lysine/ornithine hydrolase